MELSELLFNILYGSLVIFACCLVLYTLISWSIDEWKYIKEFEDDDEYEE